jgi:FkbM family methyltransferase
MKTIYQYIKIILYYIINSSSLKDFLQLLRFRLAPSKIGFLIHLDNHMTPVNLRFFNGNVFIRKLTTDICVIEELMINKGYSELFEYMNNDVLSIVDLGANIGLASRLFLKKFPRSKIVCVEPDRGNVKVLQLNLEDFRDRTEVVAACIGDRKRYVALTTDSGEWGYKMKETNADDDERVEVITFQDLTEKFNLEKVDLLKCDIEGAESELFKTCAPWINKVKMICIECHDPYTINSLVTDLNENGATFSVLFNSRKNEFHMEVAILKNMGNQII